MDSTTVVFLALSAIAVVAAFRVVTTPKIMHAALWLGASFVAVAGIFIVLNAEFLAAAQVLIYVGAITTIIVFGIMLSEASDLADKSPQSPVVAPQPKVPFSARLKRGAVPALAATAFALVMVFIYSRTEWPAMPETTMTDTTHAIGMEMFTRFIIPFELAAVLLLVALVGAIIMATKEEKEEDQ